MRQPFKLLRIVGSLLALLCATPALLQADAVILKDGTRLEGDVKHTPTGYTVTGADGKSTSIGTDSVETIEMGSGSKNSAASAAENLASLRRSAEALANPAQVLERYHRFIDMNKGTPAANDAKADIATWQDRLDRGLQKVGVQWVTPEQKAELVQQAGTKVAQAAELVRQGRVHDAEPLVQQALDADPTNPGALYLRGVMLYTTDQIPASRKAFETVNTVIADHAPTLNNLAVVLWRQNQMIPALQYYDQGIAAAPVNKILLDNVTEALAAVPDNQRKNAIVVKLTKHFTDQDATLQSIMARNGLHRWGSSWVDGPTLDKLKAAEKEINDKLDQLSADITAARSRIGDIGRSIDANSSSMQQMEANSYTRDANNNLVRLPLPEVYYTLQNENAKLASERTALQTKIATMFEQGKRVKQQMPVPQFSGVQHLIGAEGTPLPSAANSPPPQKNPSSTPTPTSRPAASRPSGTPVLIPLP